VPREDFERDVTDVLALIGGNPHTELVSAFIAGFRASRERSNGSFISCVESETWATEMATAFERWRAAYPPQLERRIQRLEDLILDFGAGAPFARTALRNRAEAIRAQRRPP
jgi:hypothetical protein